MQELINQNISSILSGLFTILSLLVVSYYKIASRVQRLESNHEHFESVVTEIRIGIQKNSEIVQEMNRMIAVLLDRSNREDGK
jgi:hypothetical protein